MYDNNVLIRMCSLWNSSARTQTSSELPAGGKKTFLWSCYKVEAFELLGFCFLLKSLRTVNAFEGAKALVVGARAKKKSPKSCLT